MRHRHWTSVVNNCYISSEMVTARAAFSADGIVGPFSHNDKQNAHTLAKVHLNHSWTQYSDSEIFIIVNVM